MFYGYARVSTKGQRLDRQISNIKSVNENAIIYKEKFTGTTLNRPQWQLLMSRVKKGDTIIFDEVSRMSRNADEGFQEYKRLYEMGVSLQFVKNPTMNTELFRRTQELALTGSDVDIIIEAINQYLFVLAEKQFKAAFDAAESEWSIRAERQAEGISKALERGRKWGNQKGCKLVTKKSISTKVSIKKHSKDFGGNLNDSELAKMTGVSRNSIRKYKQELFAELESKGTLE